MSEQTGKKKLKLSVDTMRKLLDPELEEANGGRNIFTLPGGALPTSSWGEACFPSKTVGCSRTLSCGGKIFPFGR
jgi:hypothetical protein